MLWPVTETAFLGSTKGDEWPKKLSHGGEWRKKLFHDQPSRKLCGWAGI